MKYVLLITLFAVMSLSPVYAEPPEGGARGQRAEGERPSTEEICARRAERQAAHANREGGQDRAAGERPEGGSGGEGARGGKRGKGGKHGKGGKGRGGPQVDCS